MSAVLGNPQTFERPAAAAHKAEADRIGLAMEEVHSLGLAREAA